MAIYHCSVKIIGRESGRSAVASAAYRSGAKLVNEYDGITHDYESRNAVASAAYRSGQSLTNEQGVTHDFTNKKGVVYSEIMLPENAPREFLNRETLWNSVEKIEKQKNARTAREVEIALPNELNREQQIKLVQDYIRENFVNEGMCADFSIHSGHKHRKDKEYPDAQINKNNPHAHIMLTVRPLNKDGTWGAKGKKEYITDRYGKRIKSGKEWKSRKIDATNWNDKETLLKWRENWAKMANRHLERAGSHERIDHRTLKAQGIEREPTRHEGVAVRQMEKRGIVTEIGQKNRAIIGRNFFERHNQELLKLERELKMLEKDKRDIEGIVNRIDELRKRRENRVDTKDIDYQIKGLEYSLYQTLNTIERDSAARERKPIQDKNANMLDINAIRRPRPIISEQEKVLIKQREKEREYER